MRSERGRLPQALVDVLLARGIERSELHGCRPDEIERVRVAQRVDALPSVYVEFLTVMAVEQAPSCPGPMSSIRTPSNSRQKHGRS